MSLSTVVGLFWGGAHFTGDVIQAPSSYRVGLWLPLITLPFALLLPGQLARGFAPRSRAPLARLHYLILVLAAALVLVGAFFWNLVPWKG